MTDVDVDADVDADGVQNIARANKYARVPAIAHTQGTAPAPRAAAIDDRGESCTRERLIRRSGFFRLVRHLVKVCLQRKKSRGQGGSEGQRA